MGLVCLVLLAVFLVWTLVFVALALGGAFRLKHFPIWLGVPALLIVALVCVCSAMSWYQSLPRVVFRDAVGFEPTGDIAIVNSLRHEPVDWEDSYLEFYASDRTIKRIVESGFVSIAPADVIRYSHTPQWWSPPDGPSVRIYATNTRDPNFRNEDFRYFVSHKLLIYDPDSGDPGKRRVFLRYRRS
jgi:hypothetical protein